MAVKVKFRKARVEDSELIYSFIMGIAKYEKMENTVLNTPEKIRLGIKKKHFFVIFPIYENKEVGFALYYHNYSTFTGDRGLYLEDFYLLPEYRKLGIGKKLFKKIINIAYKNNCSRMEWMCLKWNQPSIDFYKKYEAISLDETWHTFRLTKDKIEKFK